MEKFDDLMARITTRHAHLPNVTMATVNVHAETNTLRCMDIGKQSYFSVSGT